LINSFSKKSPTNIILLIIYALLLKCYYFLHITAPLQNNNDGILYKFLWGKITLYGKSGNLLSAIFCFILILIQAFKLSQIINQDKLMSKHNQLASMAYLLITSLFADWNILSSALIANTIILFVWNYITKLQNSQSPKTILFNVGLLIGLSNFIYSFSFTFLLLAIIGLITYRAFKLNEYLVLLLGFIIPFYCLFSYQYLNDSFSFNNIYQSINMHLPKFANAKWVLISVIVIGTLTVTGLYMVQMQSGKMNIQARKSWSLLFFYLLISLCIPFFSSNFAYWILCLIPAAAFIGATFLYISNKNIKTILHWSLFALAIYVSYFLH
jgi:hypothetical protein